MISPSVRRGNRSKRNIFTTWLAWKHILNQLPPLFPYSNPGDTYIVWYILLTKFAQFPRYAFTNHGPWKWLDPHELLWLNYTFSLLLLNKFLRLLGIFQIFNDFSYIQGIFFSNFTILFGIFDFFELKSMHFNCKAENFGANRDY